MQLAPGVNAGDNPGKLTLQITGVNRTCIQIEEQMLLKG